jgi:hypothetical protein
MLPTMPYRIAAQEALARWRVAQRLMDDTSPDDPSGRWQQAQVEADLAKADYQEAIEAATREHLPVPPSFAEALEDAEGADPS